MFDGEARVWPGVKDAWPWQPLVREPVDPVPSRAVLLAAPRERAPPEHHDMVPERCQGVEVVWHRVIGKEACHHLALSRKVSVLARGGISAVSARRAECPRTWSPARA